jgi:DNA end-binding protein Ku
VERLRRGPTSGGLARHSSSVVATQVRFGVCGESPLLGLVLVTPEELEPFMPAVTKTIDLDQFVDLHTIDPVFFEKPYYLAPQLNPKPYVLLARALASTGKVAIARFVMRNRQYTAAIRADGNRLVMSTLANADEVVPVEEVADLDTLGTVDVSGP